MKNSIRVVLANTYDLVVGDTFQLYYRGVIEAPNPYVYSIVAICEKGKNFPRYFEFTPDVEGQYTLTINVYDAKQNLLGSGETTLNVVEPKQQKKETNVLVIGDSLTENGQWINEVKRRITGIDGNPKGLAFNGIKFVGNCKEGEVGFEAFGGWSWHRFTQETEGSMWVECPNNRTEKDQHSLWKDENGAIWQIETLQVDYLKFNRYKDHKSPRPESGYLTHYKNAFDTSPIEIKSSCDERTSPFLNVDSKKIDLKWYAKNSKIDRIDAFYIFLGANGTLRQVAMTKNRKDYCKEVIKEAKVLVDTIHQDFPKAKVVIMANPLPSLYGGFGWNYGAELPLTNLYSFVDYVMELNIAYQNWCLEDGYKEFMEYINLASQFDSENNYPSILKPVNCRSEILEKIETNAMHPTSVGYMQIADAVYRKMVKQFFSKE